MSAVVDVVRKLVAAGASPEVILVAVEAIEAAGSVADAARAQAAERKRRQRERQRQDVTGQSRDMAETVTDEPLSRPLPPQTPLTPTHTRECVSTRTRETADFEVFWEAYPNRVAKPAARKAFAKARPKVADVEVLIAAVERQRDWDAWQRGFIPHPATWLNQERWNDEQPQPPKAHDQPRQDRPQSRRDEDLGTMLSGALVALDRYEKELG